MREAGRAVGREREGGGGGEGALLFRGEEVVESCDTRNQRRREGGHCYLHHHLHHLLHHHRDEEEEDDEECVCVARLSSITLGVYSVSLCVVFRLWQKNLKIRVSFSLKNNHFVFPKFVLKQSVREKQRLLT